MKPTRAQRALLERLLSGPKLKAQIEGSGRSMTPRQCLRAGWVRLDGDPHVKDPWGEPAAAYYITTAGREAIGRKT